jgi:hypothetical protein
MSQVTATTAQPELVVTNILNVMRVIRAKSLFPSAALVAGLGTVNRSRMTKP